MTRTNELPKIHDGNHLKEKKFTPVPNRDILTFFRQIENGNIRWIAKHIGNNKYILTDESEKIPKNPPINYVSIEDQQREYNF